MTAVNAHHVTLYIRVLALEFWQRFDRVAVRDIESVWEALFNVVGHDTGQWPAVEVKGVDMGVWISQQPDHGAVSTVEAGLTHCLHPRRTETLRGNAVQIDQTVVLSSLYNIYFF